MGYRIGINVGLLALLTWFTVTDIRRRVIIWPAAALAGVVGLLCHILVPGLQPMESIWGLIPGAALLVISGICGEAIGRGDCYVLMACGSLLGFAGTWKLLAVAMIFAGLWAVLLLAGKKAGRRSVLPFMPFLLAAQVCRLFVPSLG